MVSEDNVHAVLDLIKSGEIECWAAPEYDYVAWNKDESCVLGLLKNNGKNYTLTFTVAHLDDYKLDLDFALKVCNQQYIAMLNW